MNKLKGLATGIGSLPYEEPEAALDLIFKYTPQIPFWPQLPQRDVREGMVAQFSENLPFLKVAQDGLRFNVFDAKDRELEIFYERIIDHDVDYFKISAEFALGLYSFYQRLENTDPGGIEFIKGQITGPFSFAASIKDEKGISLLHDPVLLQAFIKGLAMKALWQVNFFAKFRKKMIVFIDEPYLGCFGSAYTPINREDVVEGLAELTAGIKSADVLLGVHCCGNTDWSIFTEINSLDIINFDAFSFLEKFTLYADNLKGFLKKGGVICWGIVPTLEFSGGETAELLVKKITDAIDALAKKGIDRDLLLNNSFISPSCGLGALDTQKPEQIFGLLAQTTSLFKKTA